MLGHSVQSYDHVNNLLYKLNGDTKKIDNLNQTFHNLELTYQIKIDTNNPNLTIGDICRAAHDSMVRQGKSESTYVALEDMEPLWAALNPAIVFEHLRSVLRNEIGVSISVYKLSNCRTYDDYAKLVKIALATNGIKQERIPGIEYSYKVMELCANLNIPVAMIKVALFYIVFTPSSTIIGKVCMDSIMIDITDIEANLNDEVYIWDNNLITLEDIARRCDTINYEILSEISDRVPREFIN